MQIDKNGNAIVYDVYERLRGDMGPWRKNHGEYLEVEHAQTWIDQNPSEQFEYKVRSRKGLKASAYRI